MRRSADLVFAGIADHFRYRGGIAKFGRFEFGKDKAAETSEGDRLELNKDYLKIVNGQPGMIELLGDSTIRLAKLL